MGGDRMDPIVLDPVGTIISPVKETREMPPGGVPAVIEIYPRFVQALHRLEENSHIWILSWFHQADRRTLNAYPWVSTERIQYGVFAIRTASRPNPVAMSLVRLLRREDNRLYLERLDAVDGTPVLDIKPYFENDIVFSPRTSYIKGKDRQYRENRMLRQALTHHQEECVSLQLAVRMALIAEEVFGHLNEPDLMVTVQGSSCLADAIQGLSNARLANPPRFKFVPHTLQQTIWQSDKGTLTLTWQGNPDVMDAEDEELLIIDFGK